MSAKKTNSSRRRSRPVKKKSMAKKFKRNKSAVFLSIFIVIILVASSSYAVFQFLGGTESDDNISEYSNINSIEAKNDVYYIFSNSINNQLDVLENDLDINKSNLKILDAEHPLYGEVSFDEKNFVYTKNSSTNKNDQFSYTVINDLNETSTANVEINIRPNAIISTSKGSIKVGLYEDKVPTTVNNFIKLADSGFYEGLVFHRVIDDFMIQGGGFEEDGTQKQSPFGPIDLEISNDVRHVDGAISMARTNDPNSATSQFFICDGAQSFLDDQYAAFGVVLDGMNVVRSIASVETTTKHGHNDWPVNEITINGITIED